MIILIICKCYCFYLIIKLMYYKKHCHKLKEILFQHVYIYIYIYIYMYYISYIICTKIVHVRNLHIENLIIVN